MVRANGLVFSRSCAVQRCKFIAAIPMRAVAWRTKSICRPLEARVIRHRNSSILTQFGTELEVWTVMAVQHKRNCFLASPGNFCSIKPTHIIEIRIFRMSTVASMPSFAAQWPLAAWSMVNFSRPWWTCGELIIRLRLTHAPRTILVSISSDRSIFQSTVLFLVFNSLNKSITARNSFIMPTCTRTFQGSLDTKSV